MFRIRQALTSESFGHDGFHNTEAEAPQSTGLFAIIDSVQTVCTLLKKHMRRRVRKTQIWGWGGGGSKQIQANASWFRSFVFTSRQGNSFFITLGTVSIPLTILPRCLCVSQGCLSSIYRADGETYNQAHICPSHHFYFLWESNLFITLTVEEKVLSDCTEFFCKYSTFWKKCASFMSDVCLVCFSPSIMPEGHFFLLVSSGWRR